MKILYYIYQICIALPILLVLTILTAIVTIVGSLLGGAHIWGYYPGKCGDFVNFPVYQYFYRDCWDCAVDTGDEKKESDSVGQ